MPTLNPDGMVVEYIENNLSPKEEEREEISKRYEDLSKMLNGVNFQSGSYARFTAITPVNDLDVIWEVDPDRLKKIIGSSEIKKAIDPIELDVSTILHDLANCLEKEYKDLGQSPRIKAQTHSVGVFFGKTDDEFSIDVVPAIPSGDKNEQGDDIYLVPEIIKMSKTYRMKCYEEKKSPIKWLRSDPKGYINDAAELNEDNEYFRKTAKFAKSWKRSCKLKNENFPLKSFHLELIVTDLYKNNLSMGCLDGICNFFEEIESYLNEPKFNDKADASKFIDDYINEIEEDELLVTKKAIIHAKNVIGKVKNTTDHDEIEKLLKELISLRIELRAQPTINTNRTRVVDAYSRPYYENL